MRVLLGARRWGGDPIVHHADLEGGGKGHYNARGTAGQAAQCGYCYNGQIIKGAELLFKNPQPTELQIRSAMNGHLCRCGTYPRILTAIERAGKAIQASTRAAASRLPEEPTRA